MGLNVGKIARNINENDAEKPVNKRNFCEFVDRDCQLRGIVYSAVCKKCKMEDPVTTCR